MGLPRHDCTSRLWGAHLYQHSAHPLLQHVARSGTIEREQRLQRDVQGGHTVHLERNLGGALPMPRRVERRLCEQQCMLRCVHVQAAACIALQL